MVDNKDLLTKETLRVQKSEIMRDFNFAKVQRVMKFLDWKWARAKSKECVPSIQELKETAEFLMEQVIEKDSMKYHYVSTGGFKAEFFPQSGLNLSFYVDEQNVE